jgi:WXG100 family type VII secretion target
MASGTEATTGRMLEVAQKVEDIIGQYNSSVEKMYRIGDEVDAMWEGPSNQKFMAKLGNDRERFNALTKLLTAYVETLRQTVSTYIEAENRALEAIGANKN